MQKTLRQNIRLYGFLKIFTKRVFLPLTAIYLMDVGGLSITQIGLLASISAIASLLTEIPTGYFADRITRKASLIMAGLFTAIATLFYAFYPSFPGAIIATILEAIGYLFLSGAAEALIHDALANAGKLDDYPKVAGRAQSIGLAGNILLVSLVPLTYTFNKQLPFLFGTIAYLLLIIIASRFVEPKKKYAPVHISHLHELKTNLRRFVFRYSLLFFVTLGIVYGLSNTSGDFMNLLFKDLGMNPSMLGIIYALSSAVGIVAGYFIHHLRKLSLTQYTLLDSLIIVGLFLIAGLSRNLVITAISFIVYMAFWRLRNILYQHHILQMFGAHKYKATLISTIHFFDRCNEVWLPVLFVSATTSFGYYLGFTIIGLGAAVILLPIFMVSIRILQTHQRMAANLLK